MNNQQIAELLETVSRFRAENDIRKSRAYFDVLGVAPCAICGHKVEYRENPETFVMCRCRCERLKKASQAIASLSAFGPIDGVYLEIV